MTGIALEKIGANTVVFTSTGKTLSFLEVPWTTGHVASPIVALLFYPQNSQSRVTEDKNLLACLVVIARTKKCQS